MFWLSVTWTFGPFVINHRERRKVHFRLRQNTEHVGGAVSKSDLIYTLAQEKDLPGKTSEEIINLMFDEMAEALASGDRIEVRGFGSFVVREYRAYTGINPKTGKPIAVKQKKASYFKVGKELRERVSKS